MREWEAFSFQNSTASFMGPQARIEKNFPGRLESLEKLKREYQIHSWTRNSRLSLAPLVGSFGTGLGHHDFIPLDCGVKEHLSCRCRAGYCRSSAGDWQSAFLQLFQPLSPTDKCKAMLLRHKREWKVLPTELLQFYLAKLINIPPLIETAQA